MVSPSQSTKTSWSTFVRDNWAKIAGAAVAVAALGFGVALLTVDHGDAGTATEEFSSRLPPGEFLYLDGPRILTYLSEMEGGEESSIHRIAGLVTSETAGANVSNFNVGASSQYETKAEGTVIRTEASELGLLLRDLADDDRKGISYHYVHPDKPGSLDEIKEGDIVRFTTHALVGPGYIRPYVVVRDSATLAALFPRELGSPASAEVALHHRHQAEVFAHQIGPDPRITFLISPGREEDKVPTILMPMRYAALTTERSLLEKDSGKHTGGAVTVFGKVVRTFDSEPTSCLPARDPCPNYTDFATREVWKQPLDHASRYLIRRVSHNCRLQAEGEAPRLEAETKAEKEAALLGRECFVEKLDRQTELFAPSAVIAPLAIIK